MALDRRDDRGGAAQGQRLVGAIRLGAQIFPRCNQARHQRPAQGQDYVGSDYPSIPYERIFKEWKELAYSDELMENIFHENAERILGL